MTDTAARGDERAIGSKDALYSAPFVDVDEWRDEPVRHRYVHGGFEGTDCKFAMYFPPAAHYEGRFFHPVLPMSGIEFAASIGVLYGIAGSIAFAVDSGAYLVESNLGRPDPFPGPDGTIAGYRASAAVARYSRVLAAEMYGPHRPYGYVYGGSGGGMKTVSCIENAPDVWDGAVPFVMGIEPSMPSVFAIQAHALRILGDKFGDIVDALDPGGSGDMYAGLTVEQREALSEITRLGFPPRGWFDWERLARGYTGVWSVLADNIVKNDPTYFSDFWTQPGYLGHAAPRSLADARVQHDTVLVSPVYAAEALELGLPMPMAMPRGTTTDDIPVALRVSDLPAGNILGASITVTSGSAVGHTMYVVGVVDNMVLTGVGEAHFVGLGGMVEGDGISIDNSVYLAFQTYHRHQVHSDFEPWDQFTAVGLAIYPQRPKLIGPTMGRHGAGSTQSGRFAGKMIVVQTLMDEAAFPWQALWYKRLVEAQLGDRIDEQYRLWYVDHAMHTGAEPIAGMVIADTSPSRRTRMVSYLGVLQQALRDLAAWVELDVAPPPSTEYEYLDGQVVVASTVERRGIQPVVTASANGAARADVTVGQPVEFVASIEVPLGTGTIVAVEWDFEGDGDYPVKVDDVDGASRHLRVTTTYSFAEPGTYLPAVRVTAHRQGDVDTAHARIQNLGRVRVVVGP